MTIAHRRALIRVRNHSAELIVIGAGVAALLVAALILGGWL